MVNVNGVWWHVDISIFKNWELGRCLNVARMRSVCAPAIGSCLLFKSRGPAKKVLPRLSFYLNSTDKLLCTAEGKGKAKLQRCLVSPQSDAHYNINENGAVDEVKDGNGAAKGLLETDISVHQKPEGKTEILEKLKRYGVAGVLSYGLLNTVYYLGVFLFVWFLVAPSPGGLGLKAAIERLLKVLALVWAGSQVTKLLRAACALALAPVIEKCLIWFTKRFNFESRGKAFGTIVIACFSLALLVFIIIVSLWA